MIEFDFRGGPKQKYWLLIEPRDVSVCLKHPGFEIDVIVTADIMAFYRVWLGHTMLTEAVRKKQVHLDGTPADIRAFPQWFTWSPMVDRSVRRWPTGAGCRNHRKSAAPRTIGRLAKVLPFRG